MKKFFQKYSYLMVRLFVTQCVIALFGSVLALAGAKSESNVLTIVISVFSVLFYLFLLYTTTWEFGNKDKPAIDGGREKFSPLTGVLIGLGANIPTFVLTLIHAVLLSTAKSTEGVLSGICGIAKLLVHYLNGMYTGLLADDIFAPGLALHKFWFVYLIITIPSVVVITIAYIMGVKEIYLTRAMVPVNAEELEIKRDKKNNQQ